MRYLLIAAACMATTGCGFKDKPDADRATNALQSGDYRAAIFEGRRLLESDPKDAAANILLARAYLMEGDAIAAERSLQSIQGSESDRTQLDQLRADLLIEQGKQQQLGELLTSDKLRLEPGFKAMYQALLEQSSGDCSKALPQFVTAIAENAQLTRARIGKAECEAGAGLTGIALSTLKEALNVQADSAHAWLAQSKLLRKLNRKAEASIALSNAVQHAPGDFSTPEYLAVLQLQILHALETENLQLARETLKKMSVVGTDAPVTKLTTLQVAIAEGKKADGADQLIAQFGDQQAQPPVQALLTAALLDDNRLEQALYSAKRLATATSAAGRLAGTQTAIENAIKLDQSQAEYWMTLANAQILLGQPMLARKAIQRAQTIQQDLPAAEYVLIQLDQAAGKNASALARAQKLVQQRPQNAAFTIKLAELLSEGKRSPEAIRLLSEQLKKTQPLDWQRSMKIQLASLHQSEGDISQAIGLLQQVATPPSASLLNNLALLYLENGDARALETAKTAARLAPTNGEIADTYGWILLKNGKAGEALKLLRAAHASNPNDAERSYHLGAALIAAGETQEGKLMIRNALGISEDFKEAAEARKLAA